jgi:uncharacterized protein (DUF302 family)
MTQEPRIVCFTIHHPFNLAQRMLRTALLREGLRIPGEISPSTRLRSELGVGLKESTIFYVDSPILLLEATVFTVGGGLYIPEPVAVCDAGDKRAKVVVRSIKPLLDDSLSAGARRAVLQLHERILQAIQSIGQREVLVPPLLDHAAAPV